MNFAAQILYSKGLRNRTRQAFSGDEEYDPFWQSYAEELFAGKSEDEGRKPGAVQQGESSNPQEGALRNCGRSPPAIHPERLKDFGEEEDCLNGGIGTWEMKIVGHGEEPLRGAPDPSGLTENRPRHKLLRYEDIKAAALQIQMRIQKTPCTYSRLSKQYGTEIYLKKEFLQYTGSVKERGVFCLLTSLHQDQQRKGVIVATDCNFSMAVAYHATELHVPVFVIMPTDTSPARVKMCRDYGAMVLAFGGTVEDSRGHAQKLAQKNGYLYLEEEDSTVFLSGLGTLGLEIFEQVPQLEAVVFPAGGHCGLLAGSAAALKHLNPRISVIGVEAERFPILQQYLKTGHPIEGQACCSHGFYRDVSGPCFGNSTLESAGQLTDRIVTVSEEDILLAMLRLLEYERATVDAEGAIGLAALVAGKLPELKGRRVAVAVCSANLELPLLRQCLDRASTLDARKCKFSVRLADSPGELSKLLDLLAREEARLLDLQQERAFVTSELFTTKVTCVAETGDRQHTARLRSLLHQRYPTLVWKER
ncbi:L-threonine ammonia-lyase-like isoform X2 [Ornithorhynchus anatinus]|uniref:L-threonine ammonia-lyase-like isoform X2 n=1 Tax=Ornithorhynchus anatinus TaxID=9258 RepID=UPI0010A7CD72|nr:L-threonine ammonia-lyase-like isoform X2 [Ornithorhynchus anatinus]